MDVVTTSKQTAKVILGRDGMGQNADEADFKSWVTYVTDHIGAATGLNITIEAAEPSDIQAPYSIYGLDDAEDVHLALDALWAIFCEDDSAWPVRDNKLAELLESPARYEIRILDYERIAHLVLFVRDEPRCVVRLTSEQAHQLSVLLVQAAERIA
jgi:hypothetical protein